MIVARSPRILFDRHEPELKYEDVIEAVDWNRVLIEAYGQHARIHEDEPNPICGQCIKTVLLKTEEDEFPDEIEIFYPYPRNQILTDETVVGMVGQKIDFKKGNEVVKGRIVGVANRPMQNGFFVQVRPNK